MIIVNVATVGITVILYVLGFACAIHALMTKTRVAASAIAWIFVCLTIPLVGVPLYLTIGQNHMERKRIRRFRMARAAFRAKGTEGGAGVFLRRDPSGRAHAFADAIERVADAPVVEGNSLEFYIDGEEAYPVMIEALRAARQSIYAQYYIFDSDACGKQFRDLLAVKAREGVEVRVLYDAVGCMKTYDGFWTPLREAGGKVEPFMPFRLLKRRWQINLRNHRKLLAIDGHSAFIGSMNIGGRHNCRSGSGESHDLQLRLKGPAVPHLIEIFASDWYFASGEDLTHSRCFIEPEPAGNAPVQIVASGPDQEHGSFHLTMLAAIAHARDAITLITPYFIPDASIMDALVLSARRGVDVTIVVPERPDSFITRLASRDHLRTMLHAGARVFEQPGPMIHMKIALIDETPALVGTSNLDHRSLFLNFEVDLVVHGKELNSELRRIVDREIAASRQLSALRDLESSALRRIAFRIGALFTPIL